MLPGWPPGSSQASEETRIRPVVRLGERPNFGGVLPVPGERRGVRPKGKGVPEVLGLAVDGDAQPGDQGLPGALQRPEGPAVEEQDVRVQQLAEFQLEQVRIR